MRSQWLEDPSWLADLVNTVMDDIQGGHRLVGLCLFVVEGDSGTFGVGINEQDGGSVSAGSDEMVSSATPRAEALVTLAEALQEKCAETRAGWGQSRPPCPYHSHPLRAELRDGEAWWTCQPRDEAVSRIGDAGAPGPVAQKQRSPPAEGRA